MKFDVICKNEDCSHAYKVIPKSKWEIGSDGTIWVCPYCHDYGFAPVEDEDFD